MTFESSLPFQVVDHLPLGKGIAPTQKIAKDQVLHSFLSATALDQPDNRSIQVGINTYVRDPFLDLINHSCDPNVFIDCETGQVQALREIEAGEIFSCFYGATEWALDQNMNCLCRSPKCIGTVCGARDISPTLFTRYKINPHIRTKLAARHSGPGKRSRRVQSDQRRLGPTQGTVYGRG